MRQVFLALALLCPFGAYAQQPPATPEQTALGQEIMECIGNKVQLRTQLARLEAELAKLRASSVAVSTSVPPSGVTGEPGRKAAE